MEGALLGRVEGIDCHATYSDRDKAGALGSEYMLTPPYIYCNRSKVSSANLFNTPIIFKAFSNVAATLLALTTKNIVVIFTTVELRSSMMDIVVNASFRIPDDMMGYILLPPRLFIDTVRRHLSRELVAELPDPRCPDIEACRERLSPRWRPRGTGGDVHQAQGSDEVH